MYTRRCRKREGSRNIYCAYIYIYIYIYVSALYIERASVESNVAGVASESVIQCPTDSSDSLTLI